MLRIMKKSKIHRATLTDANLQYTGSITIDKKIMDASNIMQDEKVLVVNVNNGARFETYAIEGEEGSGIIALNGAAARMGVVGDTLIIITFGLYGNEELIHFSTTNVFVDSHNRIEKIEKIGPKTENL